jgi:ribosome maturation factor RimP
MINKEIQKIVESFGASLYDIELVQTGEEGHIYRVLIQKEGGVDLDVCADINGVVSPYLDTNPPVKTKYYLEVSSAGIERHLRTPEHFTKSIGELVKMSLKDGTKLRGKLLSVNGDTYEIQSGDETLKVSFGDISKARTYFEWK